MVLYDGGRVNLLLIVAIVALALTPLTRNGVRAANQAQYDRTIIERFGPYALEWRTENHYNRWRGYNLVQDWRAFLVALPGDLASGNIVLFGSPQRPAKRPAKKDLVDKMTGRR